MKNILVPFDFSKPAVNAFRFALSCAGKSGGRIHLLHVIEMPVITDPLLFPAVQYEVALEAELREKAEKSFSSTISKYNIQHTEVVSSVVFGVITMTIVDYVREHRCDLVIMGSHGASGLHEAVIGSNTEKIVRRSPVPVIVVKSLHLATIKNIVFPCSLQPEFSEDFIDEIKQIQEFFRANLHVVWINTPEHFMTDVVVQDKLKEFVREHSLSADTIQTFNDLNEAEGILHYAEMMNADMIVMATHGRRGIAHLFYGSVAESVVNHAPNLIWTFSVKGVQDGKPKEIRIQEEASS